MSFNFSNKVVIQLCKKGDTVLLIQSLCFYIAREVGFCTFLKFPKPSGDSWSFLCQSVSRPPDSLSKKFHNFMYYILTCFHFITSGIKINFYCWLLQDPATDSTRTDRHVSGLYHRHTRWTPGDTGLRQGLHIWLCIWHECPARRCVPHLCRSTC